MLDAFCAFLDRQGVRYKRELRKRSYHNEGYCDVVIRSSDGRYTGIEAKVNGFGALVQQIHGNRLLYHYNYALYPSVPKTEESLNECGLMLREAQHERESQCGGWNSAHPELVEGRAEFLVRPPGRGRMRWRRA